MIKTIEIRKTTEKEARKLLREMKKANEYYTLFFLNEAGDNGLRVRHPVNGYGKCGFTDDSDPWHDYSAWSYGYTEREVSLSTEFKG